MTFIRTNFLRVVLAALAVGLFFSGRGNGTELAQDPGEAGPLAVTSRQYGSFDPAYQPPGFPGQVEQLAVVWHPENMEDNVFPLIIFLHGRHVTCYRGTTVKNAFPCPSGFQPIPNYRGYDYLAERLASHGYIVVSISANGINALDSSEMVTDGGASARAQLIQRHLDIWQIFNDGGDPWEGLFRGRVDLGNIGTMGHSRGGEGVVRHFLLNASQGSPYGVRAVLPLAPVNFRRFVINNVPLGVLLPYCDGDVSELSGAHYYDDTRYNVADDSASKHTFLVLGANHNFYNTVWTPGLFPAGAIDDWSRSRGATDPHCGVFDSGKRLTAAQQRGTAWAYIQGFFRTYVGNETQFLPYWENDAPPPPSAQTTAIHASYHPAADQRLDINRLLAPANLTENTLGGGAGHSGLALYRLCGGDPLHSDDNPRCLPLDQPIESEPHSAPAPLSSKHGLRQLHLSWTNSAAHYTNQVPQAYGDVSSFNRIQFRAGLDFTTDLNRFPTQDLSVVLSDAAGRQASVPVSDYSPALFFPPGRQFEVPKVTLNTVHIPLSAFEGIDLQNIRTVRLDFDRQSSGTLLISDLMFAQTQAAQPLNSGQVLSDLSGAADSERHYAIDVPSGTARLQVQLWGGNGDVSLYLRHGNVPSTSEFNCRAPLDGGNGECVLNSPAAGRYHLMVHGQSDYADLSLKARHTAVTALNYPLTIAKDGAGTVTSRPGGIDCGANCSASYASGTDITLTATPASGYTFVGWAGDCTGMEQPCVVPMASEKNVTAMFAWLKKTPWKKILPASALRQSASLE